MRKLIKDETGAALIIEATVIYPVVFLCVFFLIFVGLFFMQNAMLESTAQKMATLAAKEVAYPGFIDITGKAAGINLKTGMIEIQQDVYANSAIEAKKGLKAGSIRVSFDTSSVKTHPYRYWSSDPLDNTAKMVICEMIEQSDDVRFLIGGSEIEAKVSCSNYFITQYVKVTITQKVVDIGVLRFFGISAPTLKASATAPVGDSDELVRNVDLVHDAVDWLADKLGIDISKLKKTIDDALTKIGLK